MKKVLIIAVMTYVLFSCGNSSSKMEAEKSRKELAVKNLELDLLKQTKADPEGNTVSFTLGDKRITLYRGMRVDAVKELCGEPDPDFDFNVDGIQVLTYKKKNVQLFFTYGILTDYAVVDF